MDLNEKINQHVKKYKKSVLSCLDETVLNKIAQIAKWETKTKLGLITEEDIRTDEIDEDDLIISYDDPTSDMYIVLEGQAAAFGSGDLFESPEEVAFKRSVFNILNPGDVFGEFKFLDGGEKPRSANVAVFSQKIEYLKISQEYKDDFFQILLGNENMSRYFFDLLINKIRKLTDEMTEHRFLSSAEKLKRFFEKKKKHSPKSTTESCIYKIRYQDKQSIADEISVSKRTVQRLMIPLEEQGYLEVTDGWINVLKQFPAYGDWPKQKKNQ